MSDDVVTIMTRPKQELAQLISDVTPQHFSFLRKDSLITVIILDNLQNYKSTDDIEQIRQCHELTYNKIRYQSVILIDPRLEVEIQELDVTMLGMVFRRKLFGSHPTLVLTW